MTTRDDPLGEKPQPADRVVYATGVLLDAQDFETEQLYHRRQLARSLAYTAGYGGTLAGLKVAWDAAVAGEGETPGQEEQLTVQPGLAVDRLGRLIELPRAACIRLDRWYQAQDAEELSRALHETPIAGVIVAEGVLIETAVVVDLFIRFVVCERGKTPAFAAGPFDALDAVQPSRLRDSYELELVIRPLMTTGEDDTQVDPPLPQSGWPDPADIADQDERRRALQDRILDEAWHEGTDSWDKDGPAPLPEHILGQDPASLFLARLLIPATAGEPPGRTDAPVQIGNYSRPFIYATSALSKWLGI